MITILLSSARIAARGLNMSTFIAAYPDIGPCRRNGKPDDPVPIRIGDRLSVKADVSKPRPATQAFDTRRGVADMKQPVPSDLRFNSRHGGRFFKQWETPILFFQPDNHDEPRLVPGLYKSGPEPSGRQPVILFSGGSDRAPQFLERLSQTFARHLCGGTDACDQRKRESALSHPQCRDREPGDKPICGFDHAQARARRRRGQGVREGGWQLYRP